MKPHDPVSHSPPGRARQDRPARRGWTVEGLIAMVSILVGLGAGPAVRAAEDAHDNIVILLDSSGSMAERMPGTRQDKLTAAKTALKEVLQRLPASTHVGLLVFGGGHQRADDWVYPLGPREDTRLIRAIDGMHADGGTPLGAYIKRAADRLLEERARQLGYGTFRLLIVSDGEAQDQELVNRYTPEVMSRGITVDVIGVAMARRHTLATRAHSYRAANDSESLRRALHEVLGEVGGSVDDLAGADAFGQLAPIPTEVAAAALHTLATPGNQPIGERGRINETQAPPPSTPPPRQVRIQPVPAPAPQELIASRGVGKLLLAIVGLGCVGSALLALFVLARVLRGMSRRRRGPWQ